MLNRRASWGRPTVVILAGTLALAALTSCSSSSDTASSATATSSATGTTPSISATPSALPSASASTSASASPTSSGSPTPAPSGAHIGAVIPPTITGMHVAGVQEGKWPDSNVPFGTLRLWDSGTNWSQVEAVKGKYNWAALDKAIATANAHGITDILLVLGSTPTWNASKVKPGDYPVPGAASKPKDMGAWDAFVTNVVKRYKGKISAYQVWNEASLAMFWNGSPQTLAELTKRAADIIHARDPQARVVAASTTVRLAGSFDRFFPAYLSALADLGWPVDVFSAHLYPPSKGSTDVRAAYIRQVRIELKRAGAPDLPLWDTELNYGLAGPGPSNPLNPISGSKARDWVVQTELDSLHLGLDRTYWYIWTPEKYTLLGLQLTNDSGAATGLRVINQWVVGATFKGCNDNGAVVSCFLEKAGVPSIIAWSNDGLAPFVTPPGYTQACGTDNTCEEIVDNVVQLTETPSRILQ